MWCYATARSLQFIQLRDATLLHVLFNLHNYMMLCYCTFASIYTTTWCYVDWGCYATARSLQFTQLRDARLTGVGGVGGWVGRDVNVHWTCTLTWCYATARSLHFTRLHDAMLLHVLFNLHNYVMLCYCTFASTYTTTWCYVDWGGGVGGWVGGWGGMLTFIGLAHLRGATLLHVLWRNLFFPIFTEKWRLWWGQRWIHLCDVVVSNMCGDVISKLVHHWSCWKSWQSWWKTTTPTTAKRVEKRRFDAETL